MTALAPGLDAPKTDGSCFNCGSHDHFAYTCPEPVRKEPYGATVFRQRQTDKTMHGGRARGSDNSRPKGGSIVVTKYAPPPPPLPPPPFFPPPPANAWGQQRSQPYPPPPSQGQSQPPYQPAPYPPVNTGYVPPPPPSAPPYGQYNGPYGQAPYQPPPPPPSSYAPSAYPPSYAPSDRAYPPAPPQPSYVTPAYPPPYAAPDRAYPPAPSQSSYQGPPAPLYQVSPPGPPPPPPPPPPGYQGLPGPGYQASPIPPPPPPPLAFASGYQPPPGPPPPLGTYPPAPYASNFQPPAPYTNHNPPPKPKWPHDSGGRNNQRNRDRRDRRNDRDRGNKNKQHRRDNNNNQRGKHHREDASSRGPSSTPRDQSPKPSPTPTDLGTVSLPLKVESAKAEDAKTPTPEAVEDHIPKEDQFDQDALWDFEKAFVDLETKAADPVGTPLAAEWSDAPTIPPAYNAKCIKSDYYDPDNPDAFLASVRDTKHWPAVKRDPVFRFRRGMVAVQFSGSHHEYFTYHCSRRLGVNALKERETIPVPSDETLIDSHKALTNQPASVTYRHGDSPLISLNGKRNHPEADDYNGDVKRPRHRELDRSPMPRYARRPSPRDAEADVGPWAPQPGEARLDSPHRPFSRDEYSHSPGGYRLQANGRLVPYDAAQSLRNDSGYHSSSDRYRSGFDERNNTHLSPPPSSRARERDASRERERDREWDRGAREWATTREGGNRRDRAPRSPSLVAKPRTRSPSLRSRSRSRSRTAAADDSADDMDDLEYELLGMQRPATPEKKTVYKPVNKKPRVKVNDAFSRRW